MANFSNTKLTGPSLYFKKDELIKKLKKDIFKFDIPIIYEQIIEIQRLFENKKPYFLLKSNNNSYYSKSIIFATGLSFLLNEYQFYKNGIIIPCLGYDFIKEKIQTLIFDIINKNQKNIIYGNIFSLKLFDLVLDTFKKLNLTFKDLKYFLPLFIINDDIQKLTNHKLYKQFSHLFIHGKITKFIGENKLNSVLVETDYQVIKQTVDNVFIDYHSFELKPNFNINLSHDLNIFNSKTNFIKVDIYNKTKIKGIFAAGDICGPYFCLARALSSGINAAFSAYEYITKIWRSKKYYSLFAYKASKLINISNFSEIDISVLKSKIIVLVKKTKIKQKFCEYFKNYQDVEKKFNKISIFFKQFNTLDTKSFKKIAEILKIDLSILNDFVNNLIKEKLISIL